ncbi:MAG: DUF2971 domain-containing protein [Longimicrobiaceae bacterium]
MALTEREQATLNELRGSFAYGWSDHDQHLPGVLYHYTSAEGLIGVVSSKSLWLTDLRFMNDFSELKYSRDLIVKQLQLRVNNSELSDVQREFLSLASSRLDPFGDGVAAFSASFCEEGNLLSQWRTYGGYAIGFDFLHTIRLLDRPCVLRKVIYDEVQQVRLIDQVVGQFLVCVGRETIGRTVVDLPKDLLPTFCQVFSSCVGELFFSFKHPDFYEEREWRLVHFASLDPLHHRGAESSSPKFRSSDGNVIPYFSVSFEKAVEASRDDTYGVPFPIPELIIGPTISVDLNQESTLALLLTLNPEVNPLIEQSKTPLRRR